MIIDIILDRRVSIHALLAECDPFPPDDIFRGTGFNPRTPCGVRQAALNRLSLIFNVSIHALLAECDATGRESVMVSASFNPRTPCGVRHIANRGNCHPS